MRKPLAINHIALVPFAALVLAACQDTPTQTALDGELPDLAINAGNPTGNVMFRITGVLSDAHTGLWATGTPWAATVSFDPVPIDPTSPNCCHYAPVDWTFEIDGETISAVHAQLNVEPGVLSCGDCDPPFVNGDSYQYADEGNGWNGTLKEAAVVQIAINFQDHDGTQLGPQFDVTQPLNLDEWEVFNGSIELASFPPGTIEGIDVECFSVLRGRPHGGAGKPDEPGRPQSAGRPVNPGPPCQPGRSSR